MAAVARARWPSRHWNGSAQEAAQAGANDRRSKAMDFKEVSHCEATFGYALNEDAMAAEKLAEGIRGFGIDAVKLTNFCVRPGRDKSIGAQTPFSKFPESPSE
jgi:hypothetical protein